MPIYQPLFPGGKRKAFTVSYDDGVRQDERLIMMMNQYGIKGTFNLNSGLLGRKEEAMLEGIKTDVSTFAAEEIKNIYKGHEIACHALTHMKLTDISSGTAVWQVITDRQNLEGITGQIVNGFAYPFGAYDKAVVTALKSCSIHYARTVEATGAFGLPEDFLRWHPTCHHNDEKINTLLERFCLEKSLFGAAQLFYLWGHSYEFEQRNNWKDIECIFQMISQYQEEIYFATNAEIYRCLAAYKQLEFSADGNMIYNPTAVEIWLGYDDTIFSIPSLGYIKG